MDWLITPGHFTLWTHEVIKQVALGLGRADARCGGTGTHGIAGIRCQVRYRGPFGRGRQIDFTTLVTNPLGKRWLVHRRRRTHTEYRLLFASALYDVLDDVAQIIGA